MLKTFSSINKEICLEVNFNTEDDIFDTIYYSKQNFLIWKNFPLNKRIDLVKNFLKIFYSKKLEIAKRLTIESSKPIKDVNFEIELFKKKADEMINIAKKHLEVKNKDTIKPTDINQFEEHYIKDFNENKSDVALFLSYRTPNITGKHACNAITSRYFNDDKVVYFGLNDNTSKVEKREKIKEELHSIYRRYVENKETNSINNCDIYNDQLMLLKENRDYLTKLISQNKNDLDMNNKKLSVIEKKWNDIHQYILVNNINVDHCLLDNKLFKKIFLTRICNWMKENSIKFEEKEKKWRDRLISGMKLNEYEITKLKQNKYISLKDIIVGTTST